MFQTTITEEDLKSVESFMENYLINAMNKEGMSFGAMAFTIQTLVDGIKNTRKEMHENGENNEN